MPEASAPVLTRDPARPSEATLRQTCPQGPSGSGPAAAAGAFLALAGPMIISRLGLAAMSIADGVMLAQYDTRQFALHGLADALVGRSFDVAIAFMIAGMVLAAQARAGDARERETVGRVWKQALWLGTAAGVAGLLLGGFGTLLLRGLGQEPALAEGAGRVMLVLCLGMIPALWAMASAGILEALGRPLLVAIAVVVGNLLNIAFNAMLIRGVAGGPPLGAVGVALSTTAVRVLLAAVLLGCLWWSPQRGEYGLRRRFTMDEWRAGALQRARGWSAAGTVAVLAGLSLGLPLMAGWLGVGAVAEITALFLALAPCMVVAWGLADAAGLRVATALGHADGDGDGDADGGGGELGVAGLRGAGLHLAGLSLAVLLPLLAAYLWWPRSLLGLAIPDTALVERVAALMCWGAAAVLVDGLSFIYGGMLRSLGELRMPFVAQLLCGLAMLPLAYGLAFGAGWGVAGLLAGHVMAATLRVLVLAWLYDRAAGARDLVNGQLP